MFRMFDTLKEIHNHEEENSSSLKRTHSDSENPAHAKRLKTPAGKSKAESQATKAERAQRNNAKKVTNKLSAAINEIRTLPTKLEESGTCPGPCQICVI